MRTLNLAGKAENKELQLITQNEVVGKQTPNTDLLDLGLRSTLAFGALFGFFISFLFGGPLALAAFATAVKLLVGN